MADTYEFTVSVRRNGQRVSGFPITRRYTVDRSMDSTREHPDEAAQTSITNDYLTAWNSTSPSATAFTAPAFFYITADQIIRIQSRAGDSESATTFPIVLEAGGFLLAVGLETSVAINKITNAGIGVCNNGAASVERIIVGGDD